MTMTLFEQHQLPCILESRLSKRYQTLIMEHMTVNSSNAPGVKSLRHHTQSWASTQATWRFYHNEDVTFPMLSGPMLGLARSGVKESQSRYVLMAHDWCHINFAKHHSKLDKTKMSHALDVGYELQASLLVDANTGAPIAPAGLNLLTSNGIYQCRSQELQPKQSHLDSLFDSIHWQEQLDLDKPLVHVVDREADSAKDLRRLGSVHWLTRTKKGSTFRHEGQFKTAEIISRTISPDLKGVISLRGKEGYLFVGETTVELHRKSEKLASAAPTCRFVMSLVTDDEGKELARWYLLSNVLDVDATEIATWYCHRWNIESWFKLLKSDGHQLEKWQQTTAESILKRLITASVATTLIFKLYSDSSDEANEFKGFLVKLSGRLTKRTKPVTQPSLLAGLWVFLQMCEVLDTYTMDEINAMRQIASSFFAQSV
ncbi:IS4-like element ISPpr4 family transposase [Photobacterium profundum]|nr:IS4-like element ISPpr4 family transposase [Photobacterium profundum]CAG22062.1 hypothetical transposase [Photobacterium profundum SS9]CAG23178.1 hypothetical transposase [Photobacterium profundum SS9]